MFTISDIFQNIISNSFNIEQAEYFLRIVLACICGGFIGLERSSRQKEAGLRTHIILAMGSAIAIIVSKYGFFDLLNEYGISADPSRIASNIVTGISFLGAGVIFVRSGTIKGLTTAAGIWTTAAIGIAIGSGMYFIGISSTLLLIFIQIILHKFLPASERIATCELVMTAKNSDDLVEKLQENIVRHDINIVGMKINICDDNTVKFKFTVKIPKNLSMNDLILISKEVPEILSVSGEF